MYNNFDQCFPSPDRAQYSGMGVRYHRNFQFSSQNKLIFLFDIYCILSIYNYSVISTKKIADGCDDLSMFFVEEI
jgi:hypothetical protein